MINNNEQPKLPPPNPLHKVAAFAVTQVGTADDGGFYAQGVLHQDDGVPLRAFVRMKDERELVAFFKEQPNAQMSDAQAKVDAKLYMAKYSEVRDIEKKYKDQVKEVKSFNQFPDKTEGQILEENTNETILMLRGYDIVAKSRTANGDGSQLVGGNSNDIENSVFLITAKTASLTGSIKDHKSFDNEMHPEAASRVVGEKAQARQTMVRFVLDPPSKENSYQPIANAYEVTEAEDINFDYLLKNPTQFNKLLDNTMQPTHNRQPSVARQGFMDISIAYDGNKLHRFTVHSNNMVGGEHYGLDAEEYEHLSKNWYGDGGLNEQAINRFIAMEDPNTVAKNPNPDILAKNDFLRLALLASKRPNAFKEFTNKILNDDPTAFHGVTKFDYLGTKPENLTGDQLAVLGIAKSMAKDPNNTFMNLATHDKVNISENVQKSMTKFLVGSYNKQTEGTDKTAFGKTAASKETTIHPALNVVRNSQAGYGLKTLVIPAIVVEDVFPQGQTNVTVQSHVFPSFGAVPNPETYVDKGGNFKYVTESVKQGISTYFDDLHAPKHIVNGTRKAIDFSADHPLGLLKGDKPSHSGQSPDQMRKNSKFLQQFDFNFDPSEILGNQKAGMVDLSVNKAAQIMKGNDLNPTKDQAFHIISKIARGDSFEAFVRGRSESASIPMARHKEFIDVLNNVVGGLSKDNNSYSNIKTALLGVSGANGEVEQKHRDIRDLLLTDKIVAVEMNDTTEYHNFRDLTSVLINPANPMPTPLGDLTRQQVEALAAPLNPEKDRRMTNTLDNILADVGQNSLSGEDFAAASIANAHKNMQPTPQAASRPRI